MNPVDIGVVILLLASGVFALARGFVYEVLAMAGWVAAGLAALWGEPRVRPFVHQYIASPTITEVVGGAVIFLTVLVVSSFITHAISRHVRRSAISAVDRSLGFAFGLARGLLAASLGFIVVIKVMDQEPPVLAQARTRPLLVVGARLIQSVVPNHMADIQMQAKSALDLANQAKQNQAIFDQLAAPKPKSGDPADDKAPDKAGLDRLIETTNSK